MPTPALPPQTALPSEADPDPEVLADECVAVAARLVRAVRRRNPTDIAAVLASVPGGRVDALAVVLAGMVPADRGIAELLVWTVEPSLAATPPPGRHGSNDGYARHRRDGTLVCRPCAIAHTVTSRPPACRAEFARLLAAGVGIERAAQLSEPAFLLRHAHRPAA